MEKSLLQEIQGDAVDSAKDLSGILRKCRILAQRLGNEDLKVWVSKQLDGYLPEDKIPDYRIFPNPPILGDYCGAFGTKITGIQIKNTSIQEEIRDQVVAVWVVKGVREIQGMIQQSSSEVIRIAIPPEAYPYIKDPRVRDDMVLVSAVKVINTSYLEGVLDAIRNRVLNFTLELESEAEKTGAPIEGLGVQKPEIIQQIFNTQIRGDVGNVSMGDVGVTQNGFVNKGDVEALRKTLQDEIGLNQEEAEEFVEAASVDVPLGEGAWGKRVSALAAKILAKAGEGLLKVPFAVAASLLAEALKKYYGFS